MRRVHLANAVVEQVLSKGEYSVLHAMWEDSDLEGWERAEELAKALDIASGGKLVLIDTGDYIIPECGHSECETYDALYRLILVHQDAWARIEAEALEAHRCWLEERQRCQRQGREREPEREREQETEAIGAGR